MFSNMLSCSKRAVDVMNSFERNSSRYLLIHDLSQACCTAAKTLVLLELSIEASRPHASIICSPGHTLSVVVRERTSTQYGIPPAFILFRDQERNWFQGRILLVKLGSPFRKALILNSWVDNQNPFQIPVPID